MSGFYGVLGNDDSSEEDTEHSKNRQRATSTKSGHSKHQRATSGTRAVSGKKRPNSVPVQRTTKSPPEQPSSASVDIPSFEDLSVARVDEETVLRAVYGDEFSREDGPWGCSCLRVFVRPLEIEPAKVGSDLLLSCQLSKQYPYVAPRIEMKQVRGLSMEEQNELSQQLQHRAKQLASTGSVMMLELVQVAEKFLHEHNRDPTLSAWEQMKEREKLQEDKELQAQQEISDLMNAGSTSATNPVSPSDSERNLRGAQRSGLGDLLAKDAIDSGDLERELVRQRLALEEARRVRGQDFGLQRYSSGATAPDAVNASTLNEEDEDTDSDDDYYATLGHQITSASRYQTDFVELGVLGRGGGGEVVKVRNRLDRRVYAIKKIVLESEKGQYAKFGVVQNQKLRREVTTISRMTHKNIVRYYQAWVEGDGQSDNGVPDASPRGSSTRAPGADDDVVGGQEEEDSDPSGQGWWANSPATNDGAAGPLKNQPESSSWSESSSHCSSEAADKFEENDFNASGYDDLETFVGSPLLTGFGFQSQAYETMVDRSKQRRSQSSEQEDDVWDEESSVKVGTGVKGRSILYIQMQYCETTLRKLIDENEMKENDVWKYARQLLESLAYIHEQNIIHRDLKPGNIFLDSERNIQLGDFGLATRHQTSKASSQEFDTESEAGSIYEAIEDITRLLGRSQVAGPDMQDVSVSATGESMTGGVGTTFYRAPEQEAQEKVRRSGKSSSYTVQADIFSFGVILFEMFHPPFSTYMERAGILEKVRGDRARPANGGPVAVSDPKSRFPETFTTTVPENAQRLILWCLERNPKDRPSAKDLLSSELLPRKIELEQRYLEEALEILTSAQSDSHVQILNALFAKPTQDIQDIAFDTDVAVKANNIEQVSNGKRVRTPSESLMKAISTIRAGAVDVLTLGSLAMSASSLMAATAALNRAELTGRLGKWGKGVQKRSTQRAAGVLAMRAATSAAVTGAMDGVHGADPSVVENVCESLKHIFRNHGAVHLKTPLLRPSQSHFFGENSRGPAELLNSRGLVLTLPEDLTAGLARSIGRGGAATANLKRFDIDRVFHKSVAGGHPREMLEASFDIVQEDHREATQIQAEAILATQQVISLLRSQKRGRLSFGAESPLWFFRIGHTRLSDAILDLCGVPTREATRKHLFDLLSHFLSPSPFSLTTYESNVGKKKRRKKRKEEINKHLKQAVSAHSLSKQTVAKVEALLETPLSPIAKESVETLKRALSKLRSMESKESADPKRLRRFEDSARNLRSLSDLIDVVESILQPVFARQTPTGTPHSRPLFLSIDLGLRQKRKTYHGGIIFQAILLPDSYFDDIKEEETNEELVFSSGRGMKIAEGGEFSELVRKNRPPGNFASTFLQHYTTSPIPFCFGVRFSVGKLVELLYVGAAMDHLDGGKDASTGDIVQMRKLLGHPLRNANSVDAMVVSVNGIDSSCLPERFLVASKLWSDGVSAEYLPQSGVLLSLLKQMREDSQEPMTTSDWSLLELYGVCALLNIPFVVIVQPHLLRDKNSVRLVHVAASDSSGSSSSISSETFVSLDDLSATIMGGAESEPTTDDYDQPAQTMQPQSNSSRTARARVNCIYVEGDLYFGGDREVSKSETSNWKTYLKTMKKVEFQAEAFLGSVNEVQDSGMHGVPVFAVADVSFWALRDFGTSLMRLEANQQSANGAFVETAERYPKYKKPLKTLASSIDAYMRRQGIWTFRDAPTSSSSTSTSSLLTALLYSKTDDRFDVITLNLQSNHRNGQGGHSRRK